MVDLLPVVGCKLDRLSKLLIMGYAIEETFRAPLLREIGILQRSHIYLA